MGLETGSDLTHEALAAAMPDRAIRAYPALLSTQAEALAWARDGAPHGALVVADYQASPRGRAGRPWELRPGEGLGFSLILRPDLPPAREGWLFPAAIAALADLIGDEARTSWPDEVLADGRPVAGIGVDTEFGGLTGGWAVVTVRIDDVPPQARRDRLAAAADAIERRSDQPTEAVLADYLPRCDTIGRRVRARLIPLGPAGPEVVGRAVDVRIDGALSILTDDDRRIAVRPHHLGILDLE